MASSTSKDVLRFNRWAGTYEQSFMQRIYFGPVHAMMLDLIARERSGRPPRDILDVGCGSGRLLRLAAVRWPEAQLSGADPAEQMIAVARRLTPNVDFKIAAAESLPFADQSFDLVCSSLSFHHWANQPAAVKSIARVLRPGGHFCLADHAFPLAGLFNGRVRSPGQVRGMLTTAGFTIVRQQTSRPRFVLVTLAAGPPMFR
jgi:ubiquinone/menaquinone biosynthesis C-methylase UbiE